MITTVLKNFVVAIHLGTRHSAYVYSIQSRAEGNDIIRVLEGSLIVRDRHRAVHLRSTHPDEALPATKLVCVSLFTRGEDSR